MNLSNLLQDIENLGAISLTECVSKLSPNLKRSISVNDTTLKFWWYWVDNPSTNYIISTNPCLNSCWWIHEWRRNGYRTIYKTKLIFSNQRFPHWSCPSRIIFFSNQGWEVRTAPRFSLGCKNRVIEIIWVLWRRWRFSGGSVSYCCISH